MRVFRRPSEAAVHRLLAAAQLPDSDLQARQLEDFFGCGPAQAPLGIGGIELHGSDALLRSIAVDGPARGRGCGRALVAALEAHAREHAVRRVYLLTTTAPRFFERLGYGVVPRDAAPASIRASAQFASLCPASALCMAKDLD